MKWVKENYQMAIFNFLVLIILGMGGSAVNSVQVDLDGKADKNMVGLEFTTIKNQYVSKLEVDTIIDRRLTIQEARQRLIMMDAVKEVVSQGNENLEKILNIHYSNIDSRLQRLEK